MVGHASAGPSGLQFRSRGSMMMVMGERGGSAGKHGLWCRLLQGMGAAVIGPLLALASRGLLLMLAGVDLR